MGGFWTCIPKTKMAFAVEISTLDSLRIQVIVRAPGRQAATLTMLESVLKKYLVELEANAALDGQTLTATRAPERVARRRA